MLKLYTGHIINITWNSVPCRHLFKVNIGNTRAACEKVNISMKNRPTTWPSCCSGVSTFEFEQHGWVRTTLVELLYLKTLSLLIFNNKALTQKHFQLKLSCWKSKIYTRWNVQETKKKLPFFCFYDRGISWKCQSQISLILGLFKVLWFVWKFSLCKFLSIITKTIGTKS